jgi:hypothetical protein
MAGLDQAIGQSRLAMIDMGDNAEVPNMFHMLPLVASLCEKLHDL